MSPLAAELAELIERIVDAKVDSKLAAVLAAAHRNRDEFLTVGAAAKVAGTSPATITRRVREGDLPATGRGKARRIRRSDLERLLVEGRARDRAALTPAQLAESDHRRAVAR